MVDAQRRYRVFVLAKPGRTSTAWLTGAKDGDWLKLTAAHRFSQDEGKAICFLTAVAADTYRRHLPWHLREELRIINVEAYEPELPQLAGYGPG